MAFLILGDLAWLVVIPAALLLRDASRVLLDGTFGDWATRSCFFVPAGASTWPPLAPHGGQPGKGTRSPGSQSVTVERRG